MVTNFIICAPHVCVLSFCAPVNLGCISVQLYRMLCGASAGGVVLLSKGDSRHGKKDKGFQSQQP